MNAVATTTLAPEVLAHLDDQLASTRRLLAAVLDQGKAIRSRDVDRVLAGVSEIRTEMAVRAGMEDSRRTLLMRAGDALGIPPAAVTLDAMTRLMNADEARVARERSGELRGLLAEIGREHTVNRALMRQELAFLDHLVRVLGGEPQGAYGPAEPAGPAAPVHRALDLQA
jgi:FlgN protein